MAIRNIVKKGDEILAKKCRKVESFDNKLHTLLDDMVETMHSANGVGLAAPQISVLKQVAVVLDIDTDKIYEIINPVITQAEGEVEDIEGCLSIPGVYGYVTRPEKITVLAQDRYGNDMKIEAKGFLARAFSHEIDHLSGNLFDAKVREFIDADEVQ